jgi:hypothetical protein
MKRLCVFLVTLAACFSSVACDCIENNHARFELDEYSIINATVAVILEADQIKEFDGFVVLTARVENEIKKSVKREYVFKAKREELDFFSFIGSKLLFLHRDIISDTITINHCSQLWKWVEDFIPTQSDLNYKLFAQRYEVVTTFLSSNDNQGKAFARFSSGKKTAIGRYKNGKANGAWTHHAFNGHLFARGYYANGIKDGEWVESYFEYKINKHSMELYQEKIGYAKGTYHNGIREGKWIFFNIHSGTVVSYYKNGELVTPNILK